MTAFQEQLVEFNQLAIEHANGHEDMLNRVMTKDNIALAALLQTKEACWENGIPPDHKEVGQHILVCSAHIHWDPEFCDVKLIQTMMLMEQLREITETCGHNFRPDRHKKGSDNVHLLLCADFNSLPQSGVIEFINNGHVRSVILLYRQTLTNLSSQYHSSRVQRYRLQRLSPQDAESQ